MCECGCVMNAHRYSLPAPGKSIYVVTLNGACKSCDAPPGITIELITRDSLIYQEYKAGDFTDGPLQLEQWPDSQGVAIVTGMRQHEFVAALKEHLIGAEELDELGAEVVLEEAYADSVTRPAIVKPIEAQVK